MHSFLSVLVPFDDYLDQDILLNYLYISRYHPYFKQYPDSKRKNLVVNFSIDNDPGFMQICSDFITLHGYLIFLHESYEGQLDSFYGQIRKYQRKADRSRDEWNKNFYLDTSETIYYSDIPKWEENYLGLLEGTAMTLFFTVLERSLKTLCEAYDEEFQSNSKYFPKNTAISFIELMIEYLSMEIGFSYNISGLDNLIQKERKRRNSFIHGEWDWYTVTKDENSFIDYWFMAIKELFEIIESNWQN